MKKNLFIGATLLFALIITGCPKSPDEPVQPKKEEVSVSDVKDSGAENSVKELTDEEKTSEKIGGLFAGALVTQMSNEETQAALMQSIQPFLKSILGDSEETENLNSRAVTVDKLENVYPEFMKEVKTFLNDISIGEGDSLPESGKLEKKAAFDYSISPNGISYNDDVISIDISKLNISTDDIIHFVNVDAESGIISEGIKGEVKVDAAAKGTIDFTKVEGLEDFVIREGILQVALNGNAATDYVYDRNEDEDVLGSGKLNAGLTASSVITVIIPEGDKKYGGKILSKVSVNFDCDKMENLNEPTLEKLGEYLTINITSDLYTDDGEKVCELLKITTLKELEDLLKSLTGDVPGEDDSSEE